MKKFGQIALASAALCLCLCHAATAQSSVTIYGIADLGMEYVDNLPPAGGHTSRLISGGQAGARLGFRGTEDLGGGASAFFALESGIGMDTGELQQGGRAFGRLSYVGLESELGALSLGRHRNAIFDVAIPFDPMVYNRYSLFSVDPVTGGRVDNAVRYNKAIGPVSLSAQYSFGYDAQIPNGSEVANNSKTGREVGASLVYASGGLSAMLAYDQRQGVTPTTTALDEQRWVAAATYEWSLWKAYVGLIDLDRSIAPTMRRRTYWAGLNFKATPALTLSGAIYHHDVLAAGADSDLYALSVLYALSKRSTLYVNVGFAANDAGSTQGVVAPATAAPGQDQRGIVVGLMHRF